MLARHNGQVILVGRDPGRAGLSIVGGAKERGVRIHARCAVRISDRRAVAGVHDVGATCSRVAYERRVLRGGSSAMRSRGSDGCRSIRIEVPRRQAHTACARLHAVKQARLLS